MGSDGCCSGINQAFAKGGLLLLVFALLGLSIIQYYVQKSLYLEADNMAQLYELFVAIYVLLYIAMLLWVLFQYWTKGKICFPVSCLFFAASICFTTFSYYEVISLYTDTSNLKWQMNQPCSYEKQQYESLMVKEFDMAYIQAKTKLCTKECPCNLAINQNQAKQNNLTLEANGAYNVFKCPKIEEESTNDDIWFEENTLTLKLKYVEDHYSCSGICTKNDLFYFSNVNNGKPKKSCKEAIVDQMNSGVNLFVGGYIAVLFSSGLGTMTLFGILIYRLWVSCCKPKKKKKQAKQEKQEDKEKKKRKQLKKQLQEMEEDSDDEDDDDDEAEEETKKEVELVDDQEAQRKAKEARKKRKKRQEEKIKLEEIKVEHKDDKQIEDDDESPEKLDGDGSPRD